MWASREMKLMVTENPEMRQTNCMIHGVMYLSWNFIRLNTLRRYSYHQRNHCCWRFGCYGSAWAILTACACSRINVLIREALLMESTYKKVNCKYYTQLTCNNICPAQYLLTIVPSLKLFGILGLHFIHPFFYSLTTDFVHLRFFH